MQEGFVYPSKLPVIKNTLLARYSSKAELSFLKKIVENSQMELELNVDYDRYVENISHRVEDKVRATELKKQLAKYGVMAFVAHEDIEPSKEWMTTIENALLTMDAFIAMVTEGYNDKVWTQQEVGFAYCMNKMKGVPFISIRMNNDPKGFFSYVQAFSPQTDNYADSLCERWIDHPRMIDSLIIALKNSTCYADSARYYELLKKTGNITAEQIKQLVATFNENGSVNKCYKLNGYVGSILEFINGKTSEQYEIVMNADNSFSLVLKK